MSDTPADDDLRCLVGRCLGGDEAALTAFVRRFERAVFGLCLRMLGDRQEAEDVAQETFVRAVRNLDKWEPHRPMMPWLQTIAANRCRTALGKRPRKVNPAASLPELAYSPSLPDDTADVVEDCVSRLPADWQAAVRLFYLEGFTCGRIAGTLGCAEGTVKTWLFRGRRRLAELLRERGVESPVGEGGE